MEVALDFVLTPDNVCALAVNTTARKVFLFESVQICNTDSFQVVYSLKCVQSCTLLVSMHEH